MVRRKKGPPGTVYLTGFLTAVHLALPFYINSSFLSRFIPDGLIGYVYTAGAGASLFIFAALPRLLRRAGNLRVLQATLLVQFTVFSVLAFARETWLVLMLFLIYLLLYRLIPFCFDIFVENQTENVETGKTRGLYFMVLSAGVLVGPLIAGFIVDGGRFGAVYLLSALLLVPIALLAHRNYGEAPEPAYRTINIKETVRAALRRKSIYCILAPQFLLYFFYGWMAIYTPLYLSQRIGFPWQTIGVVFAVMLLPFVLLDVPLGRLADTRFGEKEILTAGIIILALATGALSFVTSTSALVWALLLFTTRIGASAVEIMSETYFFKQVESTDTSLIGLYHTMRPLGYTLAPLLASLALLALDLRFLFIVLGAIVLSGLYFSLTLKDTAPHPLGWRERRGKHVHLGKIR